MSQILAPLQPEYTLLIPEDSAALIGWLIGLIGIIFLGARLNDREFKLDRPTLLWSALLSVLVLVLTPFVGILPAVGPSLGLGEAPFQHLMFFAAGPWMVAGGVLGILPAMILAALSGLWLAYLDTHNIFTPLILMSVAFVFSWSVHQCYRTTFFKWLRFPLVAAVASMVTAAPLVFLALTLSAPGQTAARVGIAIERFPLVMFALSGMVLVGGVVSWIVQAFAQNRWGSKKTTQPAPGEINIGYRLLAYALPIFFLTLAGVFVITWSAAQKNARNMMVRQLTSISGVAADGLKLFLEVGESLIDEIALEVQNSPELPENVLTGLEVNPHTFRYFDQLVLYDLEGHLIAGYPVGTELSALPLDEGEDLIDSAFGDEPPSVFLTGGDSEQADRMVFIAGVRSPAGQPLWLLQGETDIKENHYAQPFTRAMDELKQQGGEGQIMSAFQTSGGEGNVEGVTGLSFPATTYFQTTTTDGVSMVQYYQPVDGRGWGILATLPTAVLDEAAWQTTYPLLVITSAAILIILLAIWIGLLPLIKEMDMMAVAIEAVAAGDFNIDQLEMRSKNSFGYFTKAFKKMVTSQQRRMEKQSKLLSVSSRVVGQFNLKDSLHIILAAALYDGATSARMVLFESTGVMSPDILENHFGLGKQTRFLAVLDQEIVELTRGKNALFLQGSEIPQRLLGAISIIDLAFVITVPLKWNDLELGVLWVAFNESHAVGEDDVIYIKELAQMASTAIVNARTYDDSQSSRTLMESIFDLLPDAVLISDQNGQILFQNKKAPLVLGLSERLLEGKSLSILFEGELDHFGWQDGLITDSKEVHFKDGKAFNFISSPIRINPNQVGQAMIFKDLTQQRKEDSLKSEFVTTVSHELRSPLTLILGYAKILRLTGNLNEQQDVYISNIIDGVEEMKDLVQKLLDIGRLEVGDPLDIQQCRADEIARRVVESMDAQAKQRNIQIAVNYPDSLLLIEADQTFLIQALKNLLENAIKFSKMGGEVSLNVRQKEERVIFAVQDKGIGIAPLDQRNLFKKFGRTSAQTGLEHEGSGLGLAIVKSIAERHGGQVWLESQLGKGSTFYFDIPRRQS